MGQGTDRAALPEAVRRVRDLEREAARIGATGPGRWFGEVAGVPVASLGVPTDWSVQALVDDPLPDDARLGELLGAMAELGSGGYQVMVGAEHRYDPRWTRHGLRESEEMPVFAMAADAAVGFTVPVPPELVIRRPRARSEFVDVYGGWCGGRHLADALVTDEDVASGRHDYWVGEVDGTCVGTAVLHAGSRSVYVSAIGVLEPFRRRGYGAALTGFATREAVRSADLEGSPVDVVWMHASADGAPLYERLGFEQVDLRVAFVRVEHR